MENCYLEAPDGGLDLTALAVIDKAGDGAALAHRDYERNPEDLFMTLGDIIGALMYMRGSVGKGYKASAPVGDYLQTGFELLGFDLTAKALTKDFFKGTAMYTDIVKDWVTSGHSFDTYLMLPRQTFR